ncbi:MAG: hypothetical protein NT049_00875 [Planctomycetota bacterium]|nr:hypothetical protein [Planctomycetota bacterium]
MAPQAGELDDFRDVRRLVDLGAREEDAEGLVVARPGLAQVVHRADDARGIQPAREARADLDVGTRKAQANGVEEQLAELLDSRLFVRHGLLAPHGYLVPLPQRKFAARQVERGALARQERPDALEERPLRVVVAVEREVIVDRRVVGPTRHVGVLQDRLDFRSENQPSARVPIVQRLDAEAVAGQEEPPPRGVVDRKGEHAVEAVEALLAPLLVGMEDDLGVGPGAKRVAEMPQFLGQLDVIVNLAVEDDVERPVFVGHRLKARVREVDDREPPVGQRHAAAGAHAAAVGSAVLLDRVHSLGKGRVFPVKTCDSAHEGGASTGPADYRAGAGGFQRFSAARQTPY